MSFVVTLWWLGFWTAVGLCLGSFLNVVIYRLPRDKSLRAPLWSACPHCEERIPWYDNLPIISFIALGGRCRSCGGAIATRYLVVEAAMALMVLMLLDAFFIGQTRAGLSTSDFGLTDHFSYDWPILVAHIILFACLLSMAAMDLEHYWVDVRFTNFATIAGFILHTLWTPRHSTNWFRPTDTTAVTALCAMAGLGLTWVVLILLLRRGNADDAEREPEPELPPKPDTDAAGEPEPSPRPSVEDAVELLPADGEAPAEPPVVKRRRFFLAPSRTLGFLAAAMLVLLFVSLVAVETAEPTLRYLPRAVVPLLLFFAVIVRESTVARESDQEIVDAIHAERHGARRMVLAEFALLLPAILFAAGGFWIMHGDSALSARISEWLHFSTRVDGLAMMRKWAPLYGLATAAGGYVIAGTLGWVLRIVFTLVFGKEAFGTGDIHMMAAAGCVLGWPVAVLGSFAAIVLALAGVIISLPFKHARAVPLVPWLALGFLTVVLFYDAMITSPWGANMVTALDMLFSRISQLLGS